MVLGCGGTALTGEESAFFSQTDPLGFILFKRNIASPSQVRGLVDDLRAAVGRADAPVLIDQEGGRVARLGPPHWRRYPTAAAIGALHAHDPALGEAAARLVGRLIGHDLASLGITVDCAPVLDVLAPESHATAIGDRAFGADPTRVAALGRRFAEGLLSAGVLPVVKHVPGHGRAQADSHHDLPRVDAAPDALEAHDFAPFRALSDMPLAMTAHVLYEAIDPERAATVSPVVVERVIRGLIGFDGLLVSDDLSMAALAGSLVERAERALAAGCDVVLHCNGDMTEMEAVARATPRMSEAAVRRWHRAAAMPKPEPIDAAGESARLDALLGGRDP